ncbi:MAG: peptidase [bacterium]
MHVLLVFIDGLGIGESDPQINPCADETLRILNNVKEACCGRVFPRGGMMIPLDATLGVEGLPQSATGQTALLTGINAAKVLGYHKQGFPHGRLRNILRQRSILKTVVEMGKKAAFINGFRPKFFEYRIKDIISTLSATTVANWAAGLPFFTLQDVIDGKAIYQDFTNRNLIDRGFDMPTYTPQQAGEILAHAAQEYDFCLYEYFKTDHAGHSQDMGRAKEEIVKLEDFLNALLSHIELDRFLLIVTSDHGNIEDLSVRRHTRNEVPAMIWGMDTTPLGDSFRSLTDIAPLILAALGEEPLAETEKRVRQDSKLQSYRRKEVIPCL